MWTHPEFRGFDRLRAWHAEQAGRVLRDHAALAGVDRRIRFWLVAVTPLALGGGLWITRRYDWRGRPVAGETQRRA